MLRRPLPEDPIERTQLTLWTFKRHAYHVLVTNLRLRPESVWRFYTKRAQVELNIRELKEAYTLAKIPTQSWQANETYFHLILVAYHLVKDEPKLITALIQQAARNKRIQAVLINGGTGISRRDSTFEAVDALLEKRLVGFGEIFRYLTYQDIGSAAIMSRATAGLYRNRIVISTPGSEGAVRLAMEKLVLPELGHMLREITK